MSDGADTRAGGSEGGFDAVRPPFVESATVQGIRRALTRVASTTFPVVIAGEPGTGRRTIANAIAAERAGRARVPLIRACGESGIPAAARKFSEQRVLPVVLVEDIGALPETDLVWLANTVGRTPLNVVATLSRSADRATRPLPAALASLLDVASHELPPLRERGADAVGWAQVFLERAAPAEGPASKTFSSGARAAILSHRWPGNLAELDLRVRRASILTDDRVIEPEDLELESPSRVAQLKSLEQAVDEFRKQYVRDALERCGGNRSLTARTLKVDVRTIFRYLERDERDGDAGGS